MKKLIVRLVFGIATMAMASVVKAAEVTPAQAQTAARNWTIANQGCVSSPFISTNVEEMETDRSETGRAVFHAINLEGGGYVIVSGDTRLSPIVAFSTTGSYSGDKSSPLYELLQKRLAGVVSALERSDRLAAASAKKSMSLNSAKVMSLYADAMEEWDTLLSPDAATDSGKRLYASKSGTGVSAVSDICVDTLLQTMWGQNCVDDGHAYYPLYNYYAPSDSTGYTYPCGCAATATAQIMYYYKMPTASIASFSNICSVDGNQVNKTSIAGTFDWNNMFLYWDPYDAIPPENQRQAIGMLTYNIGVALGMKWGPNGSTASGSVANLPGALKNRFGYKSASYLYHDLDALDYPSGWWPADREARIADFYNALYASLDAKMPVFLSINGNVGGHAVVADGYGYVSGNRYTHLNFGYEGDGDAWFHMIDETLLLWAGEAYEEEYWTFEGLVYNIHPTVAGDVISGRVTDSSSYPASGATVKLYDASNNLKATATSDSRGIYSFRITAAGNYTVQASSGSLMSQSKSVNVPTLSVNESYDAGGRTGNRWGNDLMLQAAAVTYKVTFDANGGTVSPSSRYLPAGASVGALPTPTQTGYECIGWFTAKSGGTQVTSSTIVTGSVTYYAHWRAKTCTVSFNPTNGSVSPKSKTVQYNRPYGDLPTATQTGYDFVGWFTERSGGTQVTATTKMTQTADHTLFAHWKRSAVMVTVTFSPNSTGATTAEPTRKVASGAKLGTLPTASQTGYDFVGWFTEKSGGTQITANTVVTKDVTYYAHWRAKTFTVSFNPTNGSVNPKSKTVQYNKTYGDLPTATQTGYSFLGWFTERSGGTQVTATTKMTRTADHTLFAHWKKAAATTTCTVTFNANGGAVSPTTRQVAKDAAVGTLPTPTQTGYECIGWFTAKSGGTQITASTTVSANVTYYAHWRAKTFKVSFNPTNGSVNPKSKTVQYNRPYGELPTATQTGYDFLGWFTERSGGIQVTDTTKMTQTADHTLFAHWKKAATTICTVTFDGNGGSLAATASRQVTKGAAIGSLPLALQSGYDFTGWWTSATGGSKITSETKVYGDVTYYAHWEVQPLRFNSSTWYSQTAYTHDDAAAYRSGALDNSATNRINATVTGSGTISFWWMVSSEKDFDFLEFLVDGVVYGSISGTNGNWVSFSMNIDSEDSVTHTLEWRYRKDSSQSAGLDAGFIDEMKWKSMRKITFDANGGIIVGTSSSSKAYRCETEKKLGEQPYIAADGLPKADKAGKTFAGWWTSASGGTRVTVDTVVSASTTYYAHWN